MFPPREHPECKNLEPDAESIAELMAILRGLVSKRAIFHLRFPIIARVEEMQIDASGFTLMAEPLRSIWEGQPLIYTRANFPIGGKWSMLIGGHGKFYVRYCTWGLYHDAELTREVLALMDQTPSDREAAGNLIHKFDCDREEQRRRYDSGQLFTDQKLS